MPDDKGFVIKDRRFSATEGQDQKQEPGKEKEKQAEGEKAKEEEERKVLEADQEKAMPEVRFETFIASISASALVHLGEIADPATGKQARHLPMAKHTIDILAMLEEKTRGNLAEDESQFLKNILYDLRLRYVRQA